MTTKARTADVSRLPDGLLGLFSAGGEVLYVSQAVEEALGYTVAQFARLNMLELVHPDDTKRAISNWQYLLEYPEVARLWEIRLRQADGTWRWVEVVGCNHMRDDEGAVFISFRDITERREVEMALRESEARLRAVLENSRDVTALLSAEGRLEWMSTNVVDMFGWKPEELIGIDAFDLVHPDDRTIALQDFATTITTATTSDPSSVRVRAKSGSWVPAEVAGMTWMIDDELRGVVINVRDVQWRVDAEQVRRESEERFRALVQNSQDAIMVLDKEGNATWATSSIVTLGGRTADELVGMTGFQWVHPDDLELVASELAAVLADPASSRLFDLRFQHADGSWRWLEIRMQNLLDEAAVAGIVVNARDVTDRRAAEAALQASEERLRSLMRSSGTLVLIFDRSGRIDWASPSALSTIGYAPEELLEVNAIDLTHPDDMEANFAEFDGVAEQPGASIDFVTRIKHRDGHWAWAQCTVTNRVDDPAVGGYVGHFRDITEQRTAEQALRESEQLFRSLARSSPSGIFQQNAAGECIYVNQRWEEITGLSAQEAMGHGWYQVLVPEDREQMDADGRIGTPNPIPLVELRILRPDGTIRWASVRTAPMHDSDGNFVGNVGAVDDITDRVDAQRDTRRLTDVLEASGDIALIWDGSGQLTYLNQAGRDFFGLPGALVTALGDLRNYMTPDSRAHVDAEVSPALATTGAWRGELTLIRADGAAIDHTVQVLMHRDDNGEPEFHSALLHDISARKEIEYRLAHQATHDPLTGLPNRTLLLDRLAMALARARRHGRRLAVLFLDLDHFKVVNDSLGHGLGDRLLVSIAERLATALRPDDTVARFGGDEFVVLCEDLLDRADAEAIAQRINEAVSGPFLVDDAEVFVGLSTGIAFPDDTEVEPEDLIRDADAAMYQAKQRGRARWVVFDNAMRAHAVDRLDIENALRRALERRELRVFYQPMISLQTGRIDGVEALLRWEHPERGLLLPGDFIAVAEETGLIVPIGSWVLDHACRQVQRWHALVPELEQLTLSVNLSGRQLGSPTLVDDLAAVLAETGIDPANLELEITESVLMDDVEMSGETLGRLKRQGVKVVVDDFGTGYSSLSYLRRFPVDQLKVDQSFVDGLGTDPGDSAIVTAIVTLAHTLGQQAVAEGVESEVQLSELRRLSCDRAQGFHIARPMAAADITDLLQTNPAW